MFIEGFKSKQGSAIIHAAFAITHKEFTRAGLTEDMYSEMGVAKVMPPFIHYGLYENHNNYKILSKLGKLNDWLREHLGF